MRVPDGWNTLPISEILERVSEPVFPELEKNYYQIGIRSHGKGLFYKEAVTGAALGNKRVFRIHPDCFIVNIVFAWEQAVAKTSANEIGMIASHRFPMFRPRNHQCDIDYLTYFFKTPKGKYLLELASPGGAGRNKTLGQNEFSLLKLTLPPINEQQKISQILSTWDKAIDKLEALIAAKQKRKKALMQQLLTGKKKLSGFIGNWENVRFSNLIKGKKCKGKIVPTNDYSNGLPYIGASSFDGSFGLYTDSTVAIKCVPNDILVLWDGENAGKVATGLTGAISSTVVRYNLITNKANNKFVAYRLLKDNYKIRAIREGSGIPHMPGDFENWYELSLPPFEEQQKIATILSATDNEITTHKNQLAALKQQKKALMQQLLTGKKRVI